MDPCRLVTGADVHKKPLADRRSDGVGGDAVCLRTFTAFAETEHGDFLYSPPVEGWLAQRDGVVWDTRHIKPPRPYGAPLQGRGIFEDRFSCPPYQLPANGLTAGIAEQQSGKSHSVTELPHSRREAESADAHSENGAASEPRFLRPGAEARSRSAERTLKTERPASRGFYALARKRVQEARSAL